MKGFVPTPEAAVDRMVDMLFRQSPPRADDRVLDPGSGRGAFVAGIIRYCTRHGIPLPTIVAVESDPDHTAHLMSRFYGLSQVVVRQEDFLAMPGERFDYVIGNPPYVSIEGLSEDEKTTYRREYSTASGRFDLYLLFFEKALRSLRQDGRLVFITPEKYVYVNTAAPLRRLLTTFRVGELNFFPEDTFGDLVTYPLVTVVDASPSTGEFIVSERNGVSRTVSAHLPTTSWQPILRGSETLHGSSGTLSDITIRVSCGVATGADSVFLVAADEVDDALAIFAYATLSGREIRDRSLPTPRQVMLVPYDPEGTLIPESDLGSFGAFLRQPERHARLLRRTCVQRKPWYAFHETPPLTDILRPKLLCKDIGARPLFVIDREGDILPRHSLYYIVPRDKSVLDDLAEYMNSADVAAWLSDHCQRAANGFLRLQSHVLKQLPVPTALLPGGMQLSLNECDGPAQRRSA